MLKSMRNILLSLVFWLVASGEWLVVGAALPVQKLKVLDSIPHSQTRFTQGLFFDGEDLWESTGLEGKSKIYRMNKKGETFDSIAMPTAKKGDHFGEGIAKIGNKMLWLTWHSNLGFILSASPLQILGTFKIDSEGWGLTVWRGNWLMSNGSSSLLELSSKDMSVTNKIKTPIALLNELEAVGDTLYANVWQSDSIAVILLPSGSVIKWLDFSEQAKNIRKKHPQAEVLNGIAFDGKNLWITGKNWPWIYRVATSQTQ
ncbi:MAG: glutaminyl-peptide cyclotransferase [Fibromonadaceae bacterium]|jgi:glutamine cyclotransferase|nr:glutaminyl-peptide cyclotransferase [Fibromonadaceae bacterium]